MNILITGYKGFIGQNMVKAMSEHNLYLHDWEESLDISLFKNIDWVIHLGAISSTTETNVDKIYTQNIEFTLELLHLCLENNVNIQYASSASVYGKNQDFKEDAPKSPSSHYAWSKYIIDKFVERLLPELKIFVQGFRYFNVYGQHEDHKGDQSSPYYKFEKQAKETGVIKIFEGSENFKRDFIHVNTVCEIHKAMLEKQASGIFNVGTGETKSFYDIAKEIADNYDAIIEYIPMPENIRKQYQTYTCAEISKLNGVLNG